MNTEIEKIELMAAHLFEIRTGTNPMNAITALILALSVGFIALHIFNFFFKNEFGIYAFYLIAIPSIVLIYNMLRKSYNNSVKILSENKSFFEEFYEETLNNKIKEFLQKTQDSSVDLNTLHKLRYYYQQ